LSTQAADKVLSFEITGTAFAVGARESKVRTATNAARARGWTVPTYPGHEDRDRVSSRRNAKRVDKPASHQQYW